MKTVLLPAELTAENGGKALLLGEFIEEFIIQCECGGDKECEFCDGAGQFQHDIPISWTTIKEIYKKIVANMQVNEDN